MFLISEKRSPKRSQERDVRLWLLEVTRSAGHKSFRGRKLQGLWTERATA